MTVHGPIGIALLGSTGSIGRQTLEVVAALPEQFRIVALAARTNTDLLARQIRQFQPDLVAIDDSSLTELPPATAIERGPAGLKAVATHPAAGIVVIATSGHAAIGPAVAAIQAGKTIALANKETIVCAGELIVPLARAAGVEIRPIDSEHSAIWQSLGTADRADIRQLILTASGGPFREASHEELRTATIESALAHPTWSMGGKITIDSATLMNKGLEVIEAHWLFDVPYERISVVVHPESIVHSLVEFADASQIAQLSLPDMRLPIQYALTYPQHRPGLGRPLALTEIGTLRFFPPDESRFPALRLAREAGVAGGSYPTVLSTADEVAVDAFLAGRIAFVEIAETIERALDRHERVAITDVDAIAAVDAGTRRATSAIIDSLAAR